MPLKLKLAPGEKLVVNGVVMTNGQHSTTLTINNYAFIMRESHVLLEDEVDTPTKRAYFLVQAMLLAPPPNDAQIVEFRELMDQLGECYRRPSSLELLAETRAQVDTGNFYKALAVLRRLIDYEAQLLRLDPPQWRRRGGTSESSQKGEPRVANGARNA